MLKAMACAVTLGNRRNRQPRSPRKICAENQMGLFTWAMLRPSLKEKEKNSFACSDGKKAQYSISNEVGKPHQNRGEIRAIVADVCQRFPSNCWSRYFQRSIQSHQNLVSDLGINIVFGVLLVITVLMFFSVSAMRSSLGLRFPCRCSCPLWFWASWEKPLTPWCFLTYHGTGNVGRQRIVGRKCLPPYGKRRHVSIEAAKKGLVKLPTLSSFQRLLLQPSFRLAFGQEPLGSSWFSSPLPYPLYWDHRSSLQFSSTPCWCLNSWKLRPWNQSKKPVAHDLILGGLGTLLIFNQGT